jgi:hypothetical protein
MKKIDFQIKTNGLFCFLGNHILSDSDLIHFHTDLLHEQDFSTPSTKRILAVSFKST